MIPLRFCNIMGAIIKESTPLQDLQALKKQWKADKLQALLAADGWDSLVAGEGFHVMFAMRKKQMGMIWNGLSGMSVDSARLSRQACKLTWTAASDLDLHCMMRNELKNPRVITLCPIPTMHIPKLHADDVQYGLGLPTSFPRPNGEGLATAHTGFQSCLFWVQKIDDRCMSCNKRLAFNSAGAIGANTHHWYAICPVLRI